MHIYQVKKKKPFWKDYALYCSNYRTLGKRKTTETMKRSVVSWEDGEGVNRYSSVDFSGNEILLYVTKMMDMYHYTFFQTHRICTRVNPNINYEFRVIMIVSNVGSLIATNVKLCGGMLIIREPMHMCRDS